MKNTIVFLLAILCIGCSSTAQIKRTIKKTNSFFIERMAGNIAVDPSSGKQLTPNSTISIQVYVEATAKNIKWDSAWYNGKAYALAVQSINNTVIDAGIIKGTGVRAIVKVSKGNYLWQLALEPIAAQETTINPINQERIGAVNTAPITLVGKYKGIAFRYQAGAPVELEAIPSM
jgi:uncharacterized protein YcfL